VFCSNQFYAVQKHTHIVVVNTESVFKSSDLSDAEFKVSLTVRICLKYMARRGPAASYCEVVMS
jgi:hypothetical protein